MMMSHRVHITTILLISSNVYYVHLGGDNKWLLLFNWFTFLKLLQFRPVLQSVLLKIVAAGLFT